MARSGRSVRRTSSARYWRDSGLNASAPVWADPQQTFRARSLDHLVGEQLHRVGNDKSDGRCGSEIDDQLELRRLLDRQVARLLTLENPAGVNAGTAIRIRLAGSVAHQAARHG